MGQCPSAFPRPQVPIGAVTIVIEDDSKPCCEAEACTGYVLDQNIVQPPFCSMSSAEWSSFTSQTAGLVRTYRRNRYSLVILISGIILPMVLFHPSFGIIPRVSSRHDDYDEHDEHDHRRHLRDHESDDWGCCLTTVSPVSGDYGCEGTTAVDKDDCYSFATFEDCHATDLKCVEVWQDKDKCTEEEIEDCSSDPTTYWCNKEPTKFANMMLTKHWSSEEDAWMCDECNEQNRDKNECDDDDGGRLLFVFIFLMIALNFCGIGIAIRMGCDVSTKNESVDLMIDAVLAQFNGMNSGATFTLQRQFTGACRPKGSRPYRALVISPTGAALGFGGAVPMASATPAPQGVQVVSPPPPAGLLAITIPAGAGPGTNLTVQNPNGGTMNVQVPPGAVPGQTIHVQAPAPTPIMVEATVMASAKY